MSEIGHHPFSGTVSVAGVEVALTAADETRFAVLQHMYGPAAPIGSVPDASPAVRIAYERDPIVVPDREPDAVDNIGTQWSEPGGVHFTEDGPARLCVAGGHVRVSADLDAPSMAYHLTGVLQQGLAHALAGPTQMLLHGAAAADTRGALVIVAESGRGKSTAAAAALRHGWRLLSDDLTLVRRGDATVEGFAKDVAFPREALAGSELADTAEAVGDSRDRLRLPVGMLAPGRHPLRAVVIADHSPGDGRLEPVGPDARLSTILDGFPLAPSAAYAQTTLPVLAWLARFPVFRLLHDIDPDVRVDVAARLLDEAMEAAVAAPDQ